jgi:hypothetical protein
VCECSGALLHLLDTTKSTARPHHELEQRFNGDARVILHQLLRSTGTIRQNASLHAIKSVAKNGTAPAGVEA